MTDHPSTFRADSTSTDSIGWEDRASIHRREDGKGLLHAMTALHRGSLAEMVALIGRLPEDQRGDYIIQKAGDQLLGPAEIMTLARRNDFPG